MEAVTRTLNDRGVRFIVVGGLAVTAHGYGRLTHDLDLVIRLDPDSVQTTFDALGTLGYRPSVPVTAAGFADPVQRAQWIAEKGMKVLNFVSDRHRDMPIDVFVEEPFDFEVEYGRARVEEVAPGAALRIVHLEALIRMKREAGRLQDLADIEELLLLHGDPHDEG